MSNFRHFPRAGYATLVATACLAFTGTARADDTVDLREKYYVEDPLAPHHTSGSTARLGSSVGFLFGERSDALALGLTAAGGRRWGRLAFEAEYGYFKLSERGPSNLSLGVAQRLGVIARFEAVRLGSDIVGGNSMLALYVEGGAGVAWNDWRNPGGATTIIVPEDSKRVEALGGFGIMLDHRLQEPIGFPRRIGWYLGWRLAASPHDPEPASICRGATCRPAPMMEERYVERSMLFQSSLSFTW